MDCVKFATQLMVDEGTGPTVNTADGRYFKPYKDSVGKLTIGYGRNLDDLGLSEKEVLFNLNNDIDRVVHELNVNIPWWVTLGDVRQRVLANMCFNIGIHSLLGFTHMLKAAQEGYYEEAARQLESSLWAKQVGIRSARLIYAMRNGADTDGVV